MISQKESKISSKIESNITTQIKLKLLYVIGYKTTLGIIQVNERHAPETFLLFNDSSAYLSSQTKYDTGKIKPKRYGRRLMT